MKYCFFDEFLLCLLLYLLFRNFTFAFICFFLYFLWFFFFFLCVLWLDYILKFCHKLGYFCIELVLAEIKENTNAISWVNFMEFLVNNFNNLSLLFLSSLGLPLFKDIRIVNCFRINKVVIHTLFLVWISWFYLNFHLLTRYVKRVSAIKLGLKKPDKLKRLKWPSMCCFILHFIKNSILIF